ncbi:cobyric acid synthase [Halomicroarcula sp. GCM10025817]|uniref:cobyric acid synthase n=1 Tax=Halomicroarcula sp. GCM10025817 TaxID=3252672 RepID=UPI00360C0F4D
MTTVLVAGTASHVGKSTIAAGLCRLLSNRGRDVAPFKAQNMSNNARATPGGEVGVSQYVQARAARVSPTTDHNPVLLKPRGDGESQLVVDGDAVADVSAGAYYADHWDTALAAAEAAHERLARDHDVVVAEGAGSIAEINLHDRDLANVETARFADAEVLLVADIERGGVFASIVGTFELVPEAVRDRIAGVVITKFRGDRSLLAPGIEAVEERTGVPVLGVVPYEDPGLPEEDSVSLPPVGTRAVRGDDDGVPEDRSVTVAVPRLPRISNFTDLEPLVREPGVRVAYVPPADSLADADAVVLPGSKNTVDDLLALREAGFDERLAAFEGPVVGLCGGYQMLGETLTNATLEGTDDEERVDGFGLLPVETTFSETKTVEHVTRQIRGVGPLDGAEGVVEGYEIHTGESTSTGDVTRPFATEGAATDDVLGTYLHDLFENESARDTFVRNTFAAAGIDPPREGDSGQPNPYERAARMVADHVDLGPLGVE